MTKSNSGTKANEFQVLLN